MRLRKQALGMTLAIALELAKTNPVYEDIATKFFEYFLYIADAMNHIGEGEADLWNDEDEFYYDVLHLPERQIELETLQQLPGFKKRTEWFIQNRPDLTQNIACMRAEGMGERDCWRLCTEISYGAFSKKCWMKPSFWDPLVAKLIQQFSEYEGQHKAPSLELSAVR